MLRLKHWQDAVNAVLGAWLVLSPWAIGYAGETAAMVNAVVIGLGLIAAALGATVRRIDRPRLTAFVPGARCANHRRAPRPCLAVATALVRRA